MVKDEFGENILKDRNRTYWIEPAWKMILSNKAILPVLWSFTPTALTCYPLISKVAPDELREKAYPFQEGANIDMVQNSTVLQQTSGEYGAEGYIYQELFSLPSFGGNYPVIGS